MIELTLYIYLIYIMFSRHTISNEIYRIIGYKIYMYKMLIHFYFILLMDHIYYIQK